MCTAAFSLYNCRQLGPGDFNRTLVADAAVPCAGAAFSLHRAAAAATVAFVTLVPLWFLRGMTRGPDDREQERAVARAIAADQHCTERQARDLMRDLGRNQRFSFLTAGYRPSHTWWESVDMMRKLTIVRPVP